MNNISNKKNNYPLNRHLKTKHITMISIGGSIGTGLFIASGATISIAGPGGALLSYILVSFMVYFIMSSLCELSAYIPESGSFIIYGSNYIEEGFGFAIGWNYWYNWAITIAIELVAVQLLMNFWFPKIPSWIWSLLFLSFIFIFNYISVKGFGEIEYWFSIIKIITVLIFIISGLLIITNIIPTKEKIGFSNWSIKNAPFVGNIFSFINATMISGFSFQGTELIGVTAGESENPKKNIPIAIKQIFWRILIFYISSIIIIGLIIPYYDNNLLNNDVSNITLSPFTLVFKKVGLKFSANIVNIVILISVLSSGNSGMFASTRMLFNLSKINKAPKIFCKISKNGIPINALYATTIIATLCFLSSILNNKNIYFFLLNLSSTTGFIAWLGIIISHYRFRKGYILNGNKLYNLPYYSSFFPYSDIFSFIFCIIIMLCQNIQEFFNKNINWFNILSSYIGIPIFILIWIIYKFINKTKLVKYNDMTFYKKK